MATTDNALLWILHDRQGEGTGASSGPDHHLLLAPSVLQCHYTHVSSLTAYVRVLRECVSAVVSASGLVPLESALISNPRCLFPACRGFHWFPVSHTKLAAIVTPTEYFLGLIFTPALAPPNGTSGTEAAVRDVVLVLMSAEVSQVCAGTPVRLC